MEILKRIFAGIALTDEARAVLASQLTEVDLPGKVVPPQNWHLTLRFLGPVDDVTYERFIAALDEADLGAPFGIRLAGIGCFPNPSKATVVWLGVTAGESELVRLNEIAEDAAQAAGLAPEDRPYRPHLTLARVRPPRSVMPLLEEDVETGWRVERLVIYESRLGRDGAEYVEMDSIDLRDQ